ncbi:MAG: hypothetical protein KDA87_22130 [Planctomycetales bacterium]|nr:hypothetical protein [Planctomycetales bacterium]
MSNATKTKPVFSTRHGKLDVAAWQNEGQNGRFFNVSLKRSFKQDDEWQSSQASINHNDVLGVVVLLQWADSVIQKAVETGTKPDDEKSPLATKRRGSIEVAVYQKTTENGSSYRVSLIRAYTSNGTEKTDRVWLNGSDCLAAGRLLTRTFDALDVLPSESDSSFVTAAKNEFNASEVDGDDIPF